MSLLQDLYSGKTIPCEQFGHTEITDHLDIVEETISLENDLLQSFTEQQKEKFMKLQSNRTILSSFEVDRMFSYAFKLAFNLATEIFFDLP